MQGLCSPVFLVYSQNVCDEAQLPVDSLYLFRSWYVDEYCTTCSLGRAIQKCIPVWHEDVRKIITLMTTEAKQTVLVTHAVGITAQHLSSLSAKAFEESMYRTPKS